MMERWTLMEMADRIRRKQVTARELVQAHLKRIEQVNPRLNAFACVLADQALEESSKPLGDGPLAGVPVTIKDQFDISGSPTLCGSKTRIGHVADRDATAVAKLRAAGAILLAKTNVPELVSSYETDNFITGRTVNPWNTECTPGGSSGGEAAAIAACCSPGGLGSDGGGSIRIPAHFSGIVGFKPTHRRISGGGKFPPSIPPAGLMSAPGPMARTVADCRLLFEVMQGPDDRDSLSLGKCSNPDQTKPRIGIVRQFSKVPVHPDIVMALERASSKLRECGYEVEEFELSGLERAPNVWAFFFGELGSYQTREILAGCEAEAHWTITENLRPPSNAGALSVVANYAGRERMRTATLDRMHRCNVLLTPPSSIPAMKHRERRWQIGGQSVGLFAAMAHATIWNLLGFPGLVLPFGMTAGGLPVGVQLIGRPFEDERVLEVGVRLEEARGRFPLAGGLEGSFNPLT